MKQLRLHNYEILNFDAEPLIYSPKGVTKITDHRLAKVLQKLKTYASIKISEKTLKRILSRESIDPASAIDFLKSISIVMEENQTPILRRLHIYVDWKLPQQAIDYYQQLNSNIVIDHLDLDTSPPKEITTDCLVVFATSTLNPQRLRGLYFNTIKKLPSCGVSVGFVASGHFHMTEPHLPVLKNPCAFCTIDRLIHYETARASHDHWSKLLKYCNAEHIAMPRVELDELQKLLILGVVIKASMRYVNWMPQKTTQDRALLSTTLDLTSGQFHQDVSIHWPICECLGPQS